MRDLRTNWVWIFREDSDPGLKVRILICENGIWYTESKYRFRGFREDIVE